MRKETSNTSDLLGLSSLSKKDQEEILEIHADTIFQGILLRTMPRIPEESLHQFQNILDGKDQTAIMNFLRKEVKEFDAIVEDEIAIFKNLTASSLPPLTPEEKKTIRG